MEQDIAPIWGGLGFYIGLAVGLLLACYFDWVEKQPREFDDDQED